jgi:hypothetical protein
MSQKEKEKRICALRGSYVDTLGRIRLAANCSYPSESHLGAAVHSFIDSKFYGFLSALASNERSQRAEGGATEGDASDPVDAVRGISEVAGEEGIRGGVGVCGQERGIAVDQVGGSVVCEAERR